MPLCQQYGKHGDFNKVDECLSEMKSNNIEPNVITYSTLITLYGKNDDFDKVEEFINEMELNEIVPYHVLRRTINRVKKKDF